MHDSLFSKLKEKNIAKNKYRAVIQNLKLGYFDHTSLLWTLAIICGHKMTVPRVSTITIVDFSV